MKYSEDFENVVKYCEENELFLGYGNPNGKILIIGKEQYYKSTATPDSEIFYKDLINKRKEVNETNVNSWKKNIKEKFTPDWNPIIDRNVVDNNPQTIYWNQRNIQNRQLKNKEWNLGTSNTYLHYQKIYQNVYLNQKIETKINFQKQFFITELNDLLAEKDFNYKTLKEIKQQIITKREALFRHPFFKNFSVVIIASGHYSRDFDFNIEKAFEVKFIKTKTYNTSWFNIHYSEDKKRLLIHTRQLSTSVSKELIQEISNEISSFLKR